MKIKNIIFNRNMAKFKDSFGVHPRFVISRMDKNKDDIPDQVPIHQIKIDKIGVIRENIPLRVLDPFFMKENICLYSRIEIFTEISANKERPSYVKNWRCCCNG